MSSLQNKHFQIVVLLFLSFIWGSSFILMKKSLLLFSDLELGALRIFSAGIILLPFAIKRIKNINKQQLYYISLSGFLGSGIPAFLFTIAQKHITSSEASIYNSLTPLFTLIIAIFWFKTKVNHLNILGVLIGLAGSIFLISQRSKGVVGTSDAPEYGLLLVLATIMYGFNTNHVKNNLKDVDGITITSVAFMTMIIPVLPFLLNHNFIEKFQSPIFGISLLYALILSFVGTAFALIIWNKLIKNISAIYASSVTYIIPIFACGWGLLDGEIFNLNHLIAIFCIFTGIYLINFKPKNGV
ncbi:MAG: DMT family transporter [Bacteroidales bacterium]